MSGIHFLKTFSPNILMAPYISPPPIDFYYQRESGTYVYPLVSTEISAFRESTVTFFTFIWSFSCVSSHMNFQGTWSHKFISANFTYIWSFTRMSPFVVCQMTLGSKTHVTVSKIAFKRLLTIVDPHMGQKVTFFPKSFLTAFSLTDKRSFASLQ